MFRSLDMGHLYSQDVESLSTALDSKVTRKLKKAEILKQAEFPL